MSYEDKKRQRMLVSWPLNVPFSQGLIGAYPLLHLTAINRILEAPKPKNRIESQDRNALHDTFHFLTTNFLHMSIGRKASAAQVKTLINKYAKFIEAHQELGYASYPPPSIPTQWKWAMEQWIENEKDGLKNRARGLNKNFHLEKVYKQLLGLYWLCYGSNPTTTAEGGATKFIQQYFQEMHDALDQVLYASDTLRGQIQDFWRVPSSEAIRNYIPSQSEQGKSNELIYARAIAEDLPLDAAVYGERKWIIYCFRENGGSPQNYTHLKDYQLGVAD